MSEVGAGWLRKRVRVHAAWDWRKEHPPMAEGVVVAYAPSPTITICADDGSQSDWLVTLPIDVLAEEQPIPARDGYTVELSGPMAARTQSVPAQTFNEAGRGIHYANGSAEALVGPPRKRRTPSRPGPNNVPIRFTERHIGQIQPFADEDGITVSSWVRMVIEREIAEREHGAAEDPA